MTKKHRSMLLAVITLVLCLALVAGGTYALFTDEVTMTHHLQAGTLDITLVRTNLTKTELDPATGYLKTSSVDDPNGGTDFSDPKNGDNVFGIIASKTLIVPCSSYTASMKITNNSDVAFGYWIEIVCTDKTDGEALAEQLKVTVNTGSDKSDFVGMGLTVKGANDGYVDELAIGETGTFTVTVEFLDSAIAANNIADNNVAKGQELSFDLIVHAVQLKAPSTTTP